MLFNGFPGQPGLTLAGIAHTWAFFPNAVDGVEYGNPVISTEKEPKASFRLGPSLFATNGMPHGPDTSDAHATAIEFRIEHADGESIVFTLMGPEPDDRDTRTFAQGVLKSLTVSRLESQ